MFLLALGLASLLGSRATTLGILAGLQLLVTPVVQGLHNPGVGADAVLRIPLWKVAPKELLFLFILVVALSFDYHVVAFR
jgi:hypothetical protein